MKMNLFTLGLILTMTFNAQAQEIEQQPTRKSFQELITERFREVSQLADNFTEFTTNNKINSKDDKKEALAQMCNLTSKISPTINDFLTIDLPSFSEEEIKKSLPLCSKEDIEFNETLIKMINFPETLKTFCDERSLKLDDQRFQLYLVDGAYTLKLSVNYVPALFMACIPKPIQPSNTVIE